MLPLEAEVLELVALGVRHVGRLLPRVLRRQLQLRLPSVPGICLKLILRFIIIHNIYISSHVGLGHALPPNHPAARHPGRPPVSETRAGVGGSVEELPHLGLPSNPLVLAVSGRFPST